MTPLPLSDEAVGQARKLIGRPAARELVPSTPGASARWHTHDFPGVYCRWNYHPEYEIHLIQHGTGRAIVGDHIGRFRAGHLVLVGSNLPHHWISDLDPGEVVVDRDVVFQFHPQWFSACQQLMPELGSVAALLARAARGIEFTGVTAAAAATELVAIGHTVGMPRLQHILALLAALDAAPSHETRLLASPWTPPVDGRADLVDDVLDYIFTHLEGEVRMADAAALVGLSESGFSRYFRRASGQSFTDTVRKLRLAHACQLLEHSDTPIAAICRRVGYHNLSNFNRQFLREHHLTPRAYRRAHQQADETDA